MEAITLPINGSFQTPYGELVFVYQSLDSDFHALFDIEATMTFNGIFDKSMRRRCAASMLQVVNDHAARYRVLEAHGARPIPKLPIIAPAAPLLPRVPFDCPEDIPIRHWIESIATTTRWYERTLVLLDLIESNLKTAAAQSHPPRIGLIIAGTACLLTAALESLRENTIICLEQAAFYSLTTHPAWSTAGIAWLSGIEETWLAAWLSNHAAYRRLVHLMRAARPGLPEWLAGGHEA